MSENMGSGTGRTPRLERALGDAADEMSVAIGLPETIEPGEFAFTFMVDLGDGDAVAHEITVDWDGGWTATWREDISGDEAVSPGSSAPAFGWVSWRNGTDLLVAYTWPELDLDGWAHIPGGAPGSDLTDEEAEDAPYDSQFWVELARRIANVLHGNTIVGQTGQTFQ